MLKILKILRRGLIFSYILMLVALTNSLSAQPESVRPEKYFGFKPGSDRNLFAYEELTGYLQKLAGESPRIKMLEIGTSPLGRPMYICFISTEQNINTLEQLRAINKKLALEASLNSDEKAELVAAGKVFVLATLSMHSDEVAPAQMLPLLAFELAFTQDPLLLERMNKVVLMMVPNHNPDGMDMIVEHYRKYKGTTYERTNMPGLYHKYIGHDNNRDFITLTQQDTKAIARIYNLDWFPQVMVEKHQMGSTGPRLFVPPVHDPIAENIDAGIWNWTGIFGSCLITDLTAKGLAGISQHFLFDNYWPGSTETCIWKNVIGFLTEAASVDYASPIYVEPTELSVPGKGLSEYKKSVNMPLVWPGGWWRLADIVELEYQSMLSILKTAASNRTDILKYRNDLCQKEVGLGKTIPPFYYVVPLRQHDPGELVNLVNLLQEHGVTCYQFADNVVLENRAYSQGDVVIPLAQPFRPFIKEVMEKQEFPVRHYTPGGVVIKPYDVASWSLPLHRGLEAFEISTVIPDAEKVLREISSTYFLGLKSPDQYFAVVLPVEENGSYRAAFSLLREGLKVVRIQQDQQIEAKKISKASFLAFYDSAKRAVLQKTVQEMVVRPVYLSAALNCSTLSVTVPRIALVETFFHDMDAGWTRYILESYSIPFRVIRPGDFVKTDFVKNYDIVVFPDNDRTILMEGKWKPDNATDYYLASYPPEYTGGIGKEGLEKILKFIEQGGIIVSWGGSTDLFKGVLTYEVGKDKKIEYRLPFNNIAADLKKAGLYCPGSLMRVDLLSGHSLTSGMQEQVGVFFRGEPVFTTSIPEFDMDRRVVAKFPEKEILMSGYCEQEEKLANRAELVWLKKGRGQLVLIGFDPIFRASTSATYKILFNALLLQRG